jgi:hypothetical protein
MRVRFDFELSPRVQRALKIGVPIVILLVGGVAIANVPHTFNNGDSLSAQTMNDNFSNLDSRLGKIEALSGDAGLALGHMTVWRDATGALVPVVRHTGGFAGGNPPFPAAYEVIDPASNAIWSYYPASTPSMSAGMAYEVWITSNCTGPAYIFYAPPARYAFVIPSDPTKYYMIPDNQAGTPMAGLSSQGGGPCQPGGVGGVGVPVSSLIQVSLPVGPPGTPPYHPETL